MSGRGRGHVRQDDVGRVPPESVDQRGRRILVEEILQQQPDPGYRVDLEIVDADHERIAGLRAGGLGCDLAPAARCGAEVHDPLPALEEFVLLVDLDQLEGGAGAPPSFRARTT